MSSIDAAHTESEPLLHERLERTDQIAPTGEVTDDDDDRTTAQRLRLLFPCLLLLLCIMVGNGMTDTPLNEISEAIICRNIFGQVPDPASDPRCKDSQVQSELALISGWELTFGLIPSLVVGVPFGLAADKYGRRAVILLTSVGVVLSTLLTIVICEYQDKPAPATVDGAFTQRV
ncbi:hypothetical protein BM221_009169 [Beauveria bassiana]|uniref:Major facilitator superfamily (MFS) profile domain-containing protein n=1 Tax=Beauveria bassiana TaxID=176275 RepID=A0A2N6NCI3_BEABA|nr:hypothetical protein BM221_009169 [Beauveria bassiana]